MKPSDTILFPEDIRLAIDFKIEYSESDEGFRLDKNRSGSYSWDEMLYYWYVPIELRIGQYYYNGNTWQTEKTYFKVYTDLRTDQDPKNQALSAKDTITFLDGVPNLTGTLIKFDRPILGDFEVIIYCPRQPLESKIIAERRYIYITNFKIASQRVDVESFIENKKQDTMYTNVINGEFINQADDVEIKITSKNESGLSFSKVIFGNNILDRLYCNITGSNEKPEEFIIKRIINQYNRSKIKTTQTIKDVLTPFQIITDYGIDGREFILIGENINYSTEIAEVTLIDVN
jgi:hypothetical protein